MAVRSKSEPESTGFWSYGFRPFFLFAGAYAVLAILAWLVWLALHANGAVVIKPTISAAPHSWHGHEMLFGYSAAVLTGFMLTALPNWTGTERLRGAPLIVLASTWLAGRLAVWFSSFIPAALVAVADLVHLILLLGFVTYALMRKPAPRNMIFIVLLTVLILANASIHADWIGWANDSASWGLTLAVYSFAMMIVVIGGRIVPTFTRNACRSCDPDAPVPHSFIPLEVISMMSAAALIACHFFAASQQIVTMAAMFAAVSNGIRLGFWRGFANLRQPLVWSLHLGYGFLVLGFTAIALAGFGMLGASAAQHVLAVGAVGCMTMAVMTRATLGHTGRPLVAAAGTAVAYLAIAVAALIRGFGLLVFPDGYFLIMYASSVFWMGGFTLFSFLYGPMLISRSVSGSGTG